MSNQLSDYFIMPDGTSSIHRKTLKDLLPDMDTAIVFAKLFEFSWNKFVELVKFRWADDPAVGEFLDEFNKSNEHSHVLQDWGEYISEPARVIQTTLGTPEGKVDPSILADLVEASFVTVAKEFTDVIKALGTVMEGLPSNDAKMVLKSVVKANRKGGLGIYKPVLVHETQGKNLVIFDVSGSMSRETVEKITAEVVAFSYNINAALALVSSDAIFWPAGTFSIKDVLSWPGLYGGTAYQELAPLFDRQRWDNVITIADYDSAESAKRGLAKMTAQVGQIYDISLVNQQTFLSECIAQFSSNPVKQVTLATGYCPEQSFGY